MIIMNPQLLISLKSPPFRLYIFSDSLPICKILSNPVISSLPDLSYSFGKGCCSSEAIRVERPFLIIRKDQCLGPSFALTVTI